MSGRRSKRGGGGPRPMTVKRVRQIADCQDQRRDDRSIIMGYSYFCMLGVTFDMLYIEFEVFFFRLYAMYYNLCRLSSINSISFRVHL